MLKILMEAEIWKQIVLDSKKYNYEVSNLGRIQRLDTKREMTLNYTGRYVTCAMTHEGNRKPYIVHCMVARMFVPNVDNLPYVNHINHKKFDNRSVNLEWMIHSDNVKHSHTDENRVSLGQIILKYSAITDKLVKEFKSKSEASRELCIASSTVTRLIATKDKSRGYYLKYKITPNTVKFVYDLTGFINIKEHDKYMIHPDGRVYSMYTKAMLKPRENTYYYVCLNKVNKAVHRLVAMHFIPNPQNKPFVNHRNGNKLNNHMNNLEWSTCSENNQHAIDTGLNKTAISINQYTLDGIYVQTHQSISDACRSLNIEIHCISEITRCCDKKIRYAYDFIWRYLEDASPIEPVEKVERMVGQYTLEDVFIRGFKTLADAAIAMGKNKRNTRYISQCYLGKAESVYGYKWEPI